MQIGEKQNGFTLIELILVIIILGVLAIVATPKLINLQRDARIAVLKNVGEQMRSAAYIARTKALIEGKADGLLRNVRIDGRFLRFDYGWIQSASIMFVINIPEGELYSGLDTGGYYAWFGNEFFFHGTHKCYVKYTTTSTPEPPIISYVTDEC